MALKKCLIIFALAFVVARGLPVQDDNLPKNAEKTDYRLPKDTVPSHYDIKLIPHIVEDNFTFDGETNVDFEVRETTPDVALHLRNITLDEDATKLTTKNGDVRVPKNYIYDNTTEIMRLHFNEPLEPGAYSLSMKFTGILSDDRTGFYRTSYKNDEGETVWMATTQFEATEARRAFPCWDEPALKATFNVSIKHYTNYTALSNMPVYKQSEIDDSDGKVWTHFQTTPIMSTYLVAFIVADYKNVSNEDNSINIWTRKELIPNSKIVQEIAKSAAAALQEYTNSSVRVPKMDHVSVPEHTAGAMENWGLITYSESVFEFEEGKDTFYSKYNIIDTVIHELAHQWFGNVVSPTWWKHVWLNEGFASYFQYYIADKLFPNWRAEDYFVMSIVRESLSWDVPAHMTPIDADVTTPDDISSAFSLTAYGKAPSILRMLSNILSEDVFRAGVVKYLNAHNYDSANPDCLWTALQKALNESDVPHSDYNVKEVMDTWIEQKRYPLVTVNRDYSTGETKVFQEDNGMVEPHYHDDDEDADENIENYTWWIPINYATETNPDFSDTKPTHWLTPQDNLTINGIDPKDWVLFNRQQTGYYRVNYDETNWERIADYLGTENFRKIHVLNRAQLIDDAIVLAESKRLNESIVLKLMSYLSQETDYVGWYPAFDSFHRLNTIIEMPEAAPLKQRLLQLMDNIIKDVGFEERLDEGRLSLVKRVETINWACRFGHPDCTKIASAKLVEHLNDPETHKISPDLKEWVYCSGLRKANESVWNQLYDLSQKSDSKDLFRYLSCIENPVIIEKYLNISLSNDTELPENDRIMMYYRLLDNTAMLDTEMEFVRQNWHRMTESLERPGSLIYAFARRITRKEQTEKLKAICDAYEMREEESAKIVRKCLNTIAKNVATIEKWIKMLPQQ